ncbi:Rsm22-domain-containing protein [Schizopora paradoxa]|uniref:Rsm22-domain-containing protein n=1 Tax=Schizopora paradoxa TaxID=27342 RepID=A0A0H2S902_9AGAM|nr:Rsm22-domain-containing protein [Schizopora paradoxa]
MSRVSRPHARFDFHRSSRHEAHHTNPSLDIDDSMRDVLNVSDMRSLKQRGRQVPPLDGASTARELEELEYDETWEGSASEDHSVEESESTERKSARASFGSQRIGSVFLPLEMRNAVDRVVDDRQRPQLQENAKRLFHGDAHGRSDGWGSDYDPSYRSRRQAARHAEADGTAFATVALPSHYSAVSAVLHHVKVRLGNDWTLRHVLDWGSGAGSCIWAFLYAFQKGRTFGDSEPELSQAYIESYLAMDKRDGLTAMAKKLLKDANLGDTKIRWHRGFDDSEKIGRSMGRDTAAVSAFYLSSLPTPLARKELVKEMWSSGAEVLILIDHDTHAGFQSIAEARDFLLRMGRREFEDPDMVEKDLAGCHVVAPCPHDKSCPLLNACHERLVCSFSQRLQRPAFIRKTKNVRAGHEDVGYSYVVIRRGRRPEVATDIEDDKVTSSDTEIGASFDEQIRNEAFSWPRLVFPPIKNSGHVILDSCTPEGKIMRLTIPRSQGKQPYYDARKSSWGDIFPHEPKNPPQVRYEETSRKKGAAHQSSDIGKGNLKRKDSKVFSYDKLSSDLKDSKRRSRQERERRSHKD